jgi:hypothetical protein
MTIPDTHEGPCMRTPCRTSGPLGRLRGRGPVVNTRRRHQISAWTHGRVVAAKTVIVEAKNQGRLSRLTPFVP